MKEIMKPKIYLRTEIVPVNIRLYKDSERNCIAHKNENSIKK